MFFKKNNKDKKFNDVDRIVTLILIDFNRTHLYNFRNRIKQKKKKKKTKKNNKKKKKQKKTIVKTKKKIKN